MAKRPYHLLVTRENDAAPWCPQFGDYDRATVADEMREEYAPRYAARNRQILKLADARKATADAAIAALNFVASHIVIVHVS